MISSLGNCIKFGIVATLSDMYVKFVGLALFLQELLRFIRFALFQDEFPDHHFATVNIFLFYSKFTCVASLISSLSTAMLDHCHYIF